MSSVSRDHAERIDRLLGAMSLPEKVSQLLFESPALEEHGIPEYNWWNECLHGIGRAGKATVFPQAIGMAATFDTELLFRVASAISDEGRAKYHSAIKAGNRTRYRGLTFWTPNINIFRDPRWGRGQETYGEDPFLTSEMGVTMVRGLQGDDPDYLKSAACAKHYAVHSGPEGLRHSFNAMASDQDLWDTYLPAFEALVKAGVESVMGAYNRTNGEVCCGSPTLLQKILRENWGFSGHVVSDCWAIKDFYEEWAHHIVETREEAAALAVRNGCDLNCGCTFDALILAADQGLITEEEINTSLKRLLQTRFKLGMFDPEEKVPWTDINPEVVNCPEHQALALEAAEKSMVLLKNKGDLLPLDPSLKRVSIVGSNAADVEVLLGNYYGTPGTLVTCLEGISKRAPESMSIEYRPVMPAAYPKINPANWGLSDAAEYDVVVAVIGLTPRIEGEEGDAIDSRLHGDRDDVLLPPHQIQFLRDLVKNNEKVIAVFTGGSPMAVPEDLLEKLPVVLYSWYPGEQGGTALANILFGDAVPCGRLPVTVPKSIDDLPPFEDYSMDGRTYRYSTVDPLFPFGFGLSYTKFNYNSLGIESVEISINEDLTASVEVSNVGTRAGREIVQLYLRDLEASTRVPQCKLVGFLAVDLDAGESRQVDFTVRSAQMALINEKGEAVVEPGEFELIAAGAVPNARSEELGAAKPVRKVFRVK